MRYSLIAAPLALAAGASAWNNGTISYTTEIVTAFTTFCPYATSVVHASQTYVVTEATTLTITNCPCTITKPVTVAPVATSTPAANNNSKQPAASSPAQQVPAASSPGAQIPVASKPAAQNTPVQVATTAAQVPVASKPATVIVPPTFVNSTAPVTTAKATGSSAPVASVKPFKGAANRMAASGGGLAAVCGLVAYLL